MADIGDAAVAVLLREVPHEHLDPALVVQRDAAHADVGGHVVEERGRHADVLVAAARGRR